MFCSEDCHSLSFACFAAKTASHALFASFAVKTAAHIGCNMQNHKHFSAHEICVLAVLLVVVKHCRSPADFQERPLGRSVSVSDLLRLRQGVEFVGRQCKVM